MVPLHWESFELDFWCVECPRHLVHCGNSYPVLRKLHYRGLTPVHERSDSSRSVLLYSKEGVWGPGHAHVQQHEGPGYKDLQADH